MKTDDIQSIQAHINAFMAKIDKKKPNNTLRQDILDEFGFDIESLPEELSNDPETLDEIIRRMMAERATVFETSPMRFLLKSRFFIYSCPSLAGGTIRAVCRKLQVSHDPEHFYGLFRYSVGEQPAF